MIWTSTLTYTVIDVPLRSTYPSGVFSCIDNAIIRLVFVRYTNRLNIWIHIILEYIVLNIGKTYAIQFVVDSIQLSFFQWPWPCQLIFDWQVHFNIFYLNWKVCCFYQLVYDMNNKKCLCFWQCCPRFRIESQYSNLKLCM